MDKLLKSIAQRLHLSLRKKNNDSQPLIELRRQLDVMQKSEQSLRITLLSIGDGVIVTDNEARITFLNPSAQELVGRTLEQAMGRTFSEIFHIYNSVTNEIADDIVQTVLKAKRKVNLANNMVLVRPDGTHRHISDSAAPIYDSQGNITGVVLVFSDVTEKYELQQRLRISEEQYRSTFEQAIIGMAHIDPNGRFLRINNALCKILKYSTEELLSLSIEQIVYPDDARLVRDTMTRLIENDIYTSDVPRRFLRSDGNIAWLSLSSSVIRNSKGEPLYVVSSVQDITEKKRAEEQLLQSEQRLKRAQELSHTGNWEIDLAKMQMWASDEAFRIYGYKIKADNQLPLSVAQSAVIPEHRGFMDNTLERLLKYNDPYDIEFSIIRSSDGVKRELHSMAIAERDADGKPLRVIGVLQDITDRKKLMEEYSKALATTMDGFWLCDKNVRIVLVNDAMCSMLGYNRNEIIGMHVRSFEAHLDAEGMRAQRKNMLISGADRFETRMRRKDGSILDVEVSLSYIQSSESTCAFIRDITERKLRERHIRYLSYHDALTGLYNRAFFEDECTRLYDSKLIPVTIMIGDINGLKLTNDVFGHAQGDKLLCAIAKILSDCAGPEDIVFRIGGDEFCILMPGKGSDEAKALYERIQLACGHETVHFDDGNEMHPSVALGYATRWTEERSFNEAFKEAEDAMYKRKLLERKSLHSTVISSIRMTMYEKSRETREHADRLTEMACSLGRKLELDDTQLSELELLCSLHDLGKIGIAEHILEKQGALTEEEWFEMRKHPEIGYRIAQASPELMSISEGILCHHERWDGKGYPQGLTENNIPLLARILSVVDSFDAMTYDRVYHRAISHEEALAEIEACAGSQFDPEIAVLFVDMMRV